MTMPQAAAVLQRTGSSSIEEIDSAVLDEFIDALRIDLPGAIELVEETAEAASVSVEGKAVVTRSPSQLGTDEWNKLVSRLARLFASPFGDAVRVWTKRKYGTDVRFVNCCALLGQTGTVDNRWLFSKQVSMQITPNC